MTMFSGKLQELVKIARAQNGKQAFVDPAMAAGGGMPPGGDPAAMGMDPAAMGGAPPADPAAMGGAPPADPAAGGGGISRPEVEAMIQQAVMAGGGGGAGGPGGEAGLKPKIDVNVEIMQMKNLLAKVVDTLGIPVPAEEMTATTDKLTAMAQGQDPMAGGGGAPGGDPAAAGGAGGSAIAPIGPMAGASPELAKSGCDMGTAADPIDMVGLRDKASALAAVLRRKDS